MATLIKWQGQMVTLDPDPKLSAEGKYFSLEEMQEAVGGYIEIVSLENTHHMAALIVDEDGRLKHSPLNTFASNIAKREIVGDALLCEIVHTENGMGFK